MKTPRKRKPASTFGLSEKNKVEAPLQHPSPPLALEEKTWQPIIAEPRKVVSFFNPSINEEMQKLTKVSGIVMLGTAEERSKWPVLVYKVMVLTMIMA
ncbi:MAG: hypothetical protein H0U75_09695 [Legionella sp.]|nr:hypothetical protein [Legionella sp.]